MEEKGEGEEEGSDRFEEEWKRNGIGVRGNGIDGGKMEIELKRKEAISRRK